MRFIGHRYYEIMTRWQVCSCTLYVAHPVFGLSRFEVLPPHLFVKYVVLVFLFITISVYNRQSKTGGSCYAREMYRSIKFYYNGLI